VARRLKLASSRDQIDPAAESAEGNEPKDDGEPGIETEWRCGDVGGEGSAGAEWGDDGLEFIALDMERTP